MRFLAEENQKKNGTKAQQKCNKNQGLFLFPFFGTSRGSAVPLFSRVFGTFDVNTNRTQIGHNGTEKIVLCSERLHFAKRLGICLEEEISERCAERIVHRRFSSDNVRTRTHARGTVRPHFSYDNAHARASGVHLCHLRHIRAVTERIGSGYGADQSASLLYDRGQSGGGERRRRLFFAPTTCAHYARARERRSTSHFYQRKSVAAHTFFRRLCAR